MRLRLIVEYDGRDFCGWQVQAQGRSVQGVLEQALGELCDAPVRVAGAGRTDAGVHARGQVAAVDYAGRLAPAELRRAINAHLPEDVRILDLSPAAPGFDPRRDAISKVYVYRILPGATPSPLRRSVVWYVPGGGLREPEMGRAAELLVGHHDFCAFRGAPGGAPPDEDTRRTLSALRVWRERDEIRVRAESPGFLRYMVRNLVGTLVAVGQEKLAADEIPGILAGGDRAKAGQTAPAHGLCLERVIYPGETPDG